jgi:shikimate kinase
MNRPIVILGFMACGKTTVANELARRLQCDAIDLDDFITRSEGRSPAQIIQQDGEAMFRGIETMALDHVLRDHDARVIALGGGTWSVAANRNLIERRDCASVWLDVPFEVCWGRISSGETIRPLATDRDAAQKRFATRRSDYALARQTIRVTPNDSVEQIIERILREN